MRVASQAREETRKSSALSCHAESLPNASATFCVSALADREDVIAAVRTGVLLARCSHASLSVTVLEDRILRLEPGDQVPYEALESSLSLLGTKLFGLRTANHVSHFALDATITSASFLTAASISLQIRSVDSSPLKISKTR